MVCLSAILKFGTYLKHLRIVYSLKRFIVKQLPSNLKKKSVFHEEISRCCLVLLQGSFIFFLIRINCEHCNTYPSLIQSAFILRHFEQIHRLTRMFSQLGEIGAPAATLCLLDIDTH